MSSDATLEKSLKHDRQKITRRRFYDSTSRMQQRPVDTQKTMKRQKTGLVHKVCTHAGILKHGNLERMRTEGTVHKVSTHARNIKHGKLSKIKTGGTVVGNNWHVSTILQPNFALIISRAQGGA